MNSCNISHCIQGSPEWLSLRVGRVTASRVKDIMGTKAKSSRYFWQLVSERLTGLTATTYVNDAMQWGIENEPNARAAYELEYGPTEPIGFAWEGWRGCSPDFMVESTHGGEIKCPMSTTFLQWIDAGVVPEEHLDQILFSMRLMDVDRWDFVAFDPRMPAHLQLWVKPVHADHYENRMEDIWNATGEFLDAVDAKVKALTA